MWESTVDFEKAFCCVCSLLLMVSHQQKVRRTDVLFSAGSRKEVVWGDISDESLLTCRRRVAAPDYKSLGVPVDKSEIYCTTVR